METFEQLWINLATQEESTDKKSVNVEEAPQEESSDKNSVNVEEAPQEECSNKSSVKDKNDVKDLERNGLNQNEMCCEEVENENSDKNVVKNQDGNISNEIKTIYRHFKQNSPI